MFISGFDCLARSRFHGDRGVSHHARFPSRGDVRPDQPAEAIGSFSREQYRRGAGQIVQGEFRQFLGQAQGSLIEMETQIVIAGNLAYLSPQAVTGLMNRSGEVSRLLHGLIKSMQPAEAKAKTRLVSSSGFLETRNWKPETALSAKLCHLYG